APGTRLIHSGDVEPVSHPHYGISQRMDVTCFLVTVLVRLGDFPPPLARAWNDDSDFFLQILDRKRSAIPLAYFAAGPCGSNRVKRHDAEALLGIRNFAKNRGLMELHRKGKPCAIHQEI